MKTVTADFTNEMHPVVACPNCGETYQLRSNHAAGDVFPVDCDGEDGCGCEFNVEAK